MRRWVAAVAVACAATTRAADGPDATWWRDHLTFTASLRVRGELASWFEPPAGVAPNGAERWAFFASRLRTGARLLFPHVELAVELQDTRLAGLPSDASLAPPQGALGPGPTYFANTHDTTQGETILKQAFLTLRRSGAAATVGRFEYREGLETVPADATLATIKRTRVAERLVGPFDFTHVGRAFDGVRLVYDRPWWNATAIGVAPTYGGFEISATRQISQLWLGGLALTLKRLPIGPPIDVRLFYLYYDDRRDVVKLDNSRIPGRPATAVADTGALAIHTVGAHALTAFDAGPGIVDALAWAAAQTGTWGSASHAAWAYAIEGGYQLPRVVGQPWLRAGLDRSSGDGDPFDHRHGTFFQLLPTARTYAQLPFFNLMNLTDAFASLMLRVHERVTLRSDWHWLRLTEARDLWYAGGGAQKDDAFGYTGSPAGGRHGLAQLVDLSATVDATARTTLGAYYGHAFGGDVVGATFRGRDADYGFVEMILHY